MAGTAYYDTDTNAACVVTIPAPSDNVCAEISSIVSSYSAAPTGGKITIESPSGTVIGGWDITSEGPAPVGFHGTPLPGAAGEDLIVTLAAGGGGVVGKLTVVARD